MNPHPTQPLGSNASEPNGDDVKPIRSIVIHPGDVMPPYLGPGLGSMETRWTNSPVMTLAVLFLVTGAFGIPLLWRNPRFSTWQRCLWTVLVTIYTSALFAGVVWVVRNSLDSTQGG